MSLVLRWCGYAGLVLLLAACAQMDPPPGGPEDRTPPYVVMHQPDSLAVVPGWNRPVVIQFSERISEQQVEQSVMVSPRTSPVVVDRGSREVRVFLRRGWEPGQIYHVTLRPLVQDLFNNRMAEPVQVVFSTGPEIPPTRLSGIVRDRITGEPEADARVEAIRAADSLVYAVPSDSTGQFVIAHVPEGEYLIRAFPDPNLNRLLDPFEARDSLPVSIATADTASVELSIVMPDSTPPVIASARAGAERRVEVRFDDYLDPDQELDSVAVTVTGPDGVLVPVSSITVGEPRPAEQDTAGAAEPAEPVLPSQLVVIQLAEGVELTPEAEYSLTAVGIRNVVGLVGDSEEVFTAPTPPPPPPSPDADADTVPQPEPPPGR